MTQGATYMVAPEFSKFRCIHITSEENPLLKRGSYPSVRLDV